MLNFMKIRLLGATLFHADRQDEANSRLSLFWDAPKISVTVVYTAQYN
jgi:hypothetical protein